MLVQRFRHRIVKEKVRNVRAGIEIVCRRTRNEIWDVDISVEADANWFMGAN